MPLPKLKNTLSVKLALDSVLQIRKLIFQLWQLHPKKVSKTTAKWSRFGAVSETRGLTFHLGTLSCHSWGKQAYNDLNKRLYTQLCTLVFTTFKTAFECYQKIQNYSNFQ